MVINVHAGHNPDGKVACGAAGFIKESTEARNVKKLVISKLKKLGNTVYDCTCSNGTSQGDVLAKIVKKCNEHKADLDVSIHFNAGGGTGTEVLVFNKKDSSVKYAEQICKAIAKLGYKNRGVKERTDLYVLKNTKAPALLIECCFVDSKEDTERYEAETMAQAIVDGIQSKVDTSYKVKVTANRLNVRAGAGKKYSISTTIKKGEVYTIVAEENGFGKLKSGAGWINLSYVEKV